MASIRYPSASGSGSSYWKDAVADVGSLPPAGGVAGEIRLVLDTDELYQWNGSSWILVPATGVVGPASATANAIPRFSGTTGKIIKNSGVTLSDANVMAGVTIDADDNTIADLTVANLKAGVLDTDLSSVAGTDTTIPSAKATKTAIDAEATLRSSADTTLQSNLDTHAADTTTHGTTGDIVGTSDSQVLTNKTIDGDNNTVQDLPETALKTVLANASKFFTRNASGVPESATKAVPTGAVVGISDSQVLTNKTIDADLNTLSNIANTQIKAAAGIAVNKLAALTASRAVVSDGSGFIAAAAATTTTEVGYLNGVTSAIQTQLDAKLCATSVAAVSTDLTLTNKRIHFVDTSSARSLTLPSPSTGSFIVIKDKTGSANTNNITLVRAASEKIETVAASYVLDINLGSWTIVSDGTDWFII